MKPKPGTYLEIVEAIDEALTSDLTDDSMDYVDAKLRSAGADPVELGRRLAEVAATANQESPLNPLQRASLERAAADRRFRSSRPAKRAGVTRDDLTRMIQEIVARAPELGQQARVQAHFRNLEGATESDLEDLLAELEFLVGDRPEGN